jgi:hypothetical protein
MGREPEAEFARPDSKGLELDGRVVQLASEVEAAEFWMGAVRDRLARQPIDADVDAVEIVEDRPEQLDRPPKMWPRLPPPRIGDAHAVHAQDLDGKAEPVPWRAGCTGTLPRFGLQQRRWL